MAVLELLVVVAYPLVTLLLLAVPVAHDLEKQPEPLAAVAACPALLELRALPLLRAGCLGKAAAVAAVVLLALEVLEVPEAVVLVAAVAVLHAVRTRPALVA